MKFIAPATLMASFLFAIVPPPVAAHPHIFIDTGFELVVDGQTRLTHIRITWVYDEYYSLLISEDLKIDQDFDGVLTPQDTATLTGFDMNWDQGFTGDLDATLNGMPLTLSRPMDPTATIKDGRIITTHLRAVAGSPGLAGQMLSIKAYDETYYSAYDLTLPVTITGGATCMIEKIAPDVNGELEQMRQQLLRLDADADLEENDIPMIGSQFATDVRVTCPAS